MVILLNFVEGCSFLIFGERIAENIDDSSGNMTASISGMSQSEPSLISYITNNKEQK